MTRKVKFIGKSLFIGKSPVENLLPHNESRFSRPLGGSSPYMKTFTNEFLFVLFYSTIDFLFDQKFSIMISFLDIYHLLLYYLYYCLFLTKLSRQSEGAFFVKTFET